MSILNFTTVLAISEFHYRPVLTDFKMQLFVLATGLLALRDFLFRTEIKVEGKSRAVPDPEPDELVAEKAFDKLYQKLEANGEFEGELPSALWSSSKLSSRSVVGSMLIDIFMKVAFIFFCQLCCC